MRLRMRVRVNVRRKSHLGNFNMIVDLYAMHKRIDIAIALGCPAIFLGVAFRHVAVYADAIGGQCPAVVTVAAAGSAPTAAVVVVVILQAFPIIRCGSIVGGTASFN